MVQSVCVFLAEASGLGPEVTLSMTWVTTIVEMLKSCLNNVCICANMSGSCLNIAWMNMLGNVIGEHSLLDHKRPVFGPSLGKV